MIAKEFNEKIGIDGIIVTKLDGDTRGGRLYQLRLSQANLFYI